MSRTRFASITADLLVRKGEAQPWRGIAAADLAPVAAPEPPKRVAVRIEPAAPEHDDVAREPCGAVRRCAIRLTPCEYQRLGILAVKKDITRQQALRQAVEDYLAAAEQDYGRGCGCLNREQS